MCTLHTHMRARATLHQFFTLTNQHLTRIIMRRNCFSWELHEFWYNRVAKWATTAIAVHIWNVNPPMRPLIDLYGQIGRFKCCFSNCLCKFVYALCNNWQYLNAEKWWAHRTTTCTTLAMLLFFIYSHSHSHEVEQDWMDECTVLGANTKLNEECFPLCDVAHTFGHSAIITHNDSCFRHQDTSIIIINVTSMKQLKRIKLRFGIFYELRMWVKLYWLSHSSRTVCAVHSRIETLITLCETCFCQT